MAKKDNLNIKELRALASLLGEATVKATDLVEDFHKEVVNPPFLPNTAVQKIISDVMGFTFDNIRKVTRFVNKSIDFGFSHLNQEKNLSVGEGWKSQVFSALCGIMGDYLAAENSPLAIKMELKSNAPLVRPRLLLMVHGLCMNDELWTWKAHNHGEAIAKVLGMDCLYLHYNTGRHISENGRDFDILLEKWLAERGIATEEIMILTHSMGGLLTRSALYQAGARGATWPNLVKKVFFLGTPHHGAPMERLGSYVDFIFAAVPYLTPFARLGKVRSKGIEDLRFGNIVAEDWENLDDVSRLCDHRHVFDLPPNIDFYAIAAALCKSDTDYKSRFLGDSLVQIESALGQHKEAKKCLNIPAENMLTIYEANHLELLSHLDAYAQLLLWAQL